jgi:two-component system sensor histidine kinase PilS (NtrC family)
MRNSGKLIFGSHILSDSTPKEGGTDYWRALFYLNIYRMLLSVFLVTTSMATITVGSLGSNRPELFATTSILYALLSLIFAFMIHNGWPRYKTQCQVQILVDIVIIIILYYASSGRGAGLEILLFISISASGILLGGRGALAAASAATIILALEHFYVISTNQRPMGGFTTLGFIGGGLFVTAFIIYYLSLLLRKTEVEVAQQNINIQKLGHINELIVEQLHSGVIVVDPSLQVLLINNSSRELLDIPDKIQLPLSLESLLRNSGLEVDNLKDMDKQKESMFNLPTGKKLLARYMPLGNSFENGYIILFDDYSQIEKEQRNEKFISMGRLSASIAHEIRNPLGAISHAGQLLAESRTVHANDSRLVEIIENQSDRINQIVRTILELGQRNVQNLQEIQVYIWMEKLIDDFINENGLSKSAISLTGDRDTTAIGDEEQLQHVILNLLSNALNYADTTKDPFISVKIEFDESSGKSSISIADNGPGIAKDIQDRIFEPFFTTSSTGNGLGLYIARNICLGNNGQLEYINSNTGNGFFIVTLQNQNADQAMPGILKGA